MILEQDALGYKAGTELRDVTIQEARAMECNRCGGCCNGLLPDDIVQKDPTTGLPLFIWGSKFPEDLYEKRYGQRLLQPIVFLDDSREMPYQGRIGIGDKFEDDVDGKPYTCFKCSFHKEADEPGGQTACLLYGKDKDPSDLSTIRPLNCGDFPVFSTSVDDALVGGHEFVPATGVLPACTWHGIRIVGPWKPEPYWQERWEKQQRGEEVDDLSIPADFILELERKAEAKRRELNAS